MYSDFLSLCAFTAEDITKEKERIKTAFGILGIDSKDVDVAVNRVNRYFDIGLSSIRKVLGLWLKELVDMVLAKEEGKKVIYASMPPNFQFVAAMSSASEDIYCIIPEMVLGPAMEMIFGKLSPILEAGESAGLPPGKAFCSYLQTRLAAISSGIIPMPDLLVPSCYICDHSPKADELIHEIYGVPVVYIDSPFEGRGDKWPYFIDPQRVKYIARDMEDAAEKFRDLFGYAITEPKAREAMAEEAKLFRAGAGLWALMDNDPVPIGLKDLSLALYLPAVCSRRFMQEATPVLLELNQELQQRVNQGLGVGEKGAPRILVSMTPLDPEIIEMIEGLGLTISVTSLSPPANIESAEVKCDTVWEEIADNLLRRRGSQYSSMATINQYKWLAEQYNVDGAILLHHIGCRQFCSWLPMGKVVIEKDLDIPVLVLEGDYNDSREYSAAQMKNRLETFAHIVKVSVRKKREQRRDM